MRELARRMYDDDAPYILPGGRLSPDAMKEIIEIGREALRIKEPDISGSSFRFFIGHRSAESDGPAQRSCSSVRFGPIHSRMHLHSEAAL